MAPFYENGVILGKWDIDDLFAYTTTKRVVIRDSRLTFTRLAIMLLIFVYVVIFAVVINKGYLIRDVPVGAVRSSVRIKQPTAGSPVARADSSAFPYCGSASNVSAPYPSLPCLFGDNLDAVVSPSPQSIFVTTRVTVTEATMPLKVNGNPCFLNTGTCANQTTTTMNTYYFAGVEDFTLNIQHTVYGMTSGVRSSFRDMRKGELLKYTCGDGFTPALDFLKATECSQGTNSTERIGDCASVKTFLSAGNVHSLDATLEAVDKGAVCSGRYIKPANEYARYAGLVFLVVIDYESKDESDITYKIKVVLLPNTEFKFETVEYGEDPDANRLTRYSLNRHGVAFLVMQGGYVGRFSFTELLKTLVTANALMAVAVIVVDFIVIPLLPLARVYQSYMRTLTINFSDVCKTPDGGYFVNSAQADGYKLQSDAFVYGADLSPNEEFNDNITTTSKKNIQNEEEKSTYVPPSPPSTTPMRLTHSVGDEEDGEMMREKAPYTRMEDDWRTTPLP